MGPAIFGGLLVGFLSTSWTARFVLPAGVGLVECLFLFFEQRKGLLKTHHRAVMQSQGISEADIAQIEQSLMEVSRLPLTGWKLYTWQFVWTSITALLFSLIAGAVRSFFM